TPCSTPTRWASPGSGLSSARSPSRSARSASGSSRPARELRRMKLLSLRSKGKGSYGAVSGEGVVDLGARIGKEYPTMRDLIAGDGLGRAADLAARTSPDA